MAPEDSTNIRKNVREFLRCSDYLLNIPDGDPALNVDELKLVEPYVIRLHKRYAT